MTYQGDRARLIDLDTGFKLFGAVAIAIAVLLTVGVILLSTPVGTVLFESPLMVGTVVFTMVLLVTALFVARARPR